LSKRLQESTLRKALLLCPRTLIRLYDGKSKVWLVLFFLVADDGSFALIHHLPMGLAEASVLPSASALGCRLVEANPTSKTENFSSLLNWRQVAAKGFELSDVHAFSLLFKSTSTTAIAKNASTTPAAM
jgi:hypothetical protein